MNSEQAYERIAFLIEGKRTQDQSRRARLEEQHREAGIHRPYMIGVTGSVAVGKSHFCDSLQSALSERQSNPRVEIVSTDGFLHPNAELTKLGLLETKGAPPTYDEDAFISFVQSVRTGAECMVVPVYSHTKYDVAAFRNVPLHDTDILIVEGLNVLQQTASGRPMADMFDFSIFIDAEVDDIETWYVERVIRLRREAAANHNAYHQKYVVLDESAAADLARGIWRGVNRPILAKHILPTRDQALMIVRKGSDHAICDVLMREGLRDLPANAIGLAVMSASNGPDS